MFETWRGILTLFETDWDKKINLQWSLSFCLTSLSDRPVSKRKAVLCCNWPPFVNLSYSH